MCLSWGKIAGKRVVFPRASEVDIEEFEVPQPQSHQVLIETVSSLISPGTETAWLNALPNTPMTFPQYPGYSNAGKILAIGKDVTKVRAGDRVFSTLPHATHVLGEEGEVCKFPENLSFDEASFTYLVEIALQGVRKARIELGEAVVVMGLGLVGQLALQIAKISGAMPVMGVDFFENRVALAKKLGADHAFNAKKVDTVKMVKEVTDGKGANVVIDATGSPLAPQTAVQLTRRFGRIILLGSTRGETNFNFYSVHLEGISMIGAHIRTRPHSDSSPGLWAPAEERALAFRLLSQGKLDIKDLITVKMPFEEARKAYNMLMESKDSVLAILLDWKRQ
jgi:2-desacetyl-2-hydroxyethyl bacteriochlorophyllide A dehydrogenase